MKRTLVQQATLGTTVAPVAGVSTGAPAFVPQKLIGTTIITGGIIDRIKFREAILALAWATPTGTPSSITAVVALYHDTDAAGGTMALAFTFAAALDLSAAGTAEYHAILDSLNRYIRVEITPTYAGGSSPGNLICGQLILGGSDVEPEPSALTVFGA